MRSHMALRVRAAVRSGLDRLLTRAGAILLGAFCVLALVNAGFVVSVGTTYLPTPAGLPLGAAPGADGSLPTQPGTELPRSAAFGATILAAIATTVLGQPLEIVAVRTLVAGVADRVPAEAVFYRLGRATGHALVGTFATTLFTYAVIILASIGVVRTLRAMDGPPSYVAAGAIAVVAFVVLVFVLVSLLFITHEIAVRDAGILDAVRGSWRLTAGTRLRVGLLFVPLTALQVGLAFGVGASFDGIVAIFGIGLANGLLSVVAAGFYAAAYDQLAGSPAAAWR